jgi:branched-chain amino acid aminotransferase
MSHHETPPSREARAAAKEAHGAKRPPLPKNAFFKGRIVPYAEAQVGVLTHGLNYGTAAFGGLRGYWNQAAQELFVFRIEDHIQRFCSSARLLCMDLPYTPAQLLAGLCDLLRADGYREDVYIRPLAFYADELIGVRLHNLTAEVSMVAMPFGSYLKNEEGAHATVSSWRRVDDNMIPARGKIAGSYVNSALAKSDAVRAGFDEAIVLNDDGHVCEASAANIFMVRDGAVITPPITDNILEGITRRTLGVILRDEMGVLLVERSIDRTELYLADEVFFAGTGVQIAAVTRIDHRNVGTGVMGPVTGELRRRFFSIVRGEVEKYRHWLLPIYNSPSK